MIREVKIREGKAVYVEKKQKDIEHIISMLQDAGYDPFEQLYAYAITGNEASITRKGGCETYHIFN